MKIILLFYVCIIFSLASFAPQDANKTNAFGQPVKKMSCILKSVSVINAGKIENELMSYEGEKLLSNNSGIGFIYDEQKRLSEILESGTSIKFEYGNDNRVARITQKNKDEILITTYSYPNEKQIIAIYESTNGSEKNVFDFDSEYNLSHVTSYYTEKSSGVESKESETDITYYDDILNPYYSSSYYDLQLYRTLADETDYECIYCGYKLFKTVYQKSFRENNKETISFSEFTATGSNVNRLPDAGVYTFNDEKFQFNFEYNCNK